jgi:hypothetical protein
MFNRHAQPSLLHRVPDAEINWTNFGKMTLRRGRGKSPLVIELIDGRYCGWPGGVML